MRALSGFLVCLASLPAPLAAAQPPATGVITIDYPVEGTVFPPDLAPPTFLFRDPVSANTAWTVEVRFAGGQSPLRLAASGERMRTGEIDPRCAAATNEPPKLTPQQEATRTWKPDAAVWEATRKQSVEGPATIVITGNGPAGAASRGQVTIRTAKDPVGAPIFFRDVPLMPAELEKGVIKPLPKPALPLVAWRLRYVDETESRLLVDNLPTCANCHSFSRDGKTLGLDLDGPQNDKGLYAMVPIKQQTTIRSQDVIAWSSFRGKLTGETRVGFMSQVSPDGQYVVTMVRGLEPEAPVPATAGGKRVAKAVKANFYVANFKDYRFLQVFYPTRGILAWYSRATNKLQPLPGADDPRYVHANATWSPDGQYLVFARAEARDPYPEGVPLAEKANDPNETPMRYDLYRIPFNGGMGGKAEPIAGASGNGMSNSFPKISPDGRWIVFVQARNGLLMRPDGQLYIVPVTGGRARRMNANTPLMNSWHSFSPNGRWLVFSSKSRSPYTQMFLTHVDEAGNDSPAVLVENATAANRAVNIPEFVNIGKDAWLKIDAPATEFYRIADKALELMQWGQYDASISEWRKALAMDPDDTSALSNLGAAYESSGQLDLALAQFRRVIELDPENYKAYANLGVALGKAGRLEDAVGPLSKALELNPDDVMSLSALGGVLVNAGRTAEAAKHLERAVELDPAHVDANNNLGGLKARAGRYAEAIPHFEQALKVEPRSWILHFNLGRAQAAAGRTAEGIRNVERAVEFSNGEEAVVFDKLSTLYAEAGRWQDAVGAAKRGLALAQAQGDESLSADLKTRLAQYESRLPR